MFLPSIENGLLPGHKINMHSTSGFQFCHILATKIVSLTDSEIAQKSWKSMLLALCGSLLTERVAESSVENGKLSGNTGSLTPSRFISFSICGKIVLKTSVTELKW